MADPIFLTVDDVLQAHAEQVRLYGGDPALLDRGLLESAVAMPGARFYGQYAHDGLGAMAAAYLFHLAKNHAFADGNKRTAAVAAVLFLDYNGIDFDVDELKFQELVLGVADGSVSKAEATDFFRQHV